MSNFGHITSQKRFHEKSANISSLFFKVGLFIFQIIPVFLGPLPFSTTQSRGIEEIGSLVPKFINLPLIESLDPMVTLPIASRTVLCAEIEVGDD